MLLCALLGLSPFILVSTSFFLFQRQIVADLGLDLTGSNIILGLSTAGYAFGALVGGDLIQRFPQRRLFLFCESLFTFGSLLAAAAVGPRMFGSGSVLQGFATGLMLVVALPPVVRNFEADHLPITAAAVNIGFFGATTAGPLIGGAVAMAHLWRWYYGGLAAIGVGALALAVLSLPDSKPLNPDIKFDWHAVLLAFGATFLSFYAAGALSGNGFASFRFTVPLGIGFVCFVGLILNQYHKEEPLSPVKPMWHSYPLIGTLVAMIGGGAFITFLELGLTFAMQVQKQNPLAAGLGFWPTLPGVLLSAALLGLLLRTHYLPLLILSGMLLLIGAGALLANPSGVGNIRVHFTSVAVLLGLGAGATVAPGLWLAGFSLPSKMVGRTFALVELVRSIADYILAPVILEIAHVASSSTVPTPHGIAEAAWYTTLVIIASTALGVAVYLIGGPRLPRPDLDTWLSSSEPAFTSPPLASALRKDAA
jgi:MFS family permease